MLGWYAQGKSKCSVSILFLYQFSTINPTLVGLGLKSGLRDESPKTFRLSRGLVFCILEAAW
jgi:hypothetical protein